MKTKKNEDIYDSFIFKENGINSLIYFEKMANLQ